MTDHPFQNEQRIDTQTNLARVGTEKAEVKRGWVARLGEGALTGCKMAGDVLFRFLVQFHFTQRLSQFKQDAKQIKRSGLFDSGWYRKKYQKKIRPSQNPIHHYLLEGGALGFNPNPSFDTTRYLNLHPEVAANQLNPLLHLLRLEKRVKGVTNVARCAAAAKAAMRHYEPQFARLNPSKKTILLVAHEMTRTGASILLLNIARQWRGQYNIVVLALAHGQLEDEYTQACDVLVGPAIPAEYLWSEKFFVQLFQRITPRHPISFAIVNTIVSQVVLKGLWEQDIPSLHLIHEFASCSRPIKMFYNSAFYASRLIFPAEIVRSNAIKAYPVIERKSSPLPPGLPTDCARAAAERASILDTFRPRGFPKETVVVLGVGSVNVGNGVDLWIACAKRVAEKRPAAPFRFVWVGGGYDLEEDPYSMGLADQIQRSGLDRMVAITQDVSELETAYEQADLFFLSSRLDALSQAAQDAMAHGRPVVCFKDATGLAEYLAEDPRAAFGVVPYLDLEEAANRICRLIDDAPYRQEVGAASRKLAHSRFCFESYGSRLHELGLDAAARKEIEKADRELIRQSNRFSTDFYCSPLHRSASALDLMHYTRSWGDRNFPRKPFPGFHPGIYAELQGVKNRDPLAHYLEAGQPDGPWRYEVIEDDGAPIRETSLRVGLHLHLYFPELAREIFERLQTVQSRMDLLISVPSPDAACQIESMAASYAKGKLDIRVMPNRGRDIGPFLTGFGKEIVERYDIIGHLHLKKSPHVKNRAIVANWSDFLYENLLGGKKRMADTILSRMAADPTIGLVFADDPFAIGWMGNRDCAVALADRLNLARSSLKESFNFPAGTMFWARSAALRPLLDLDMQWDDYPPEPLPVDGSSLHAIERMLPFIVERAGFRSVATHVAGVTR
jgi:glycosyltransferase involved in cell wall biosynthesis